ncbi:hypothetical protein BFP70_05120 [Thioclava sp. SK-1]|nr:hypothetical protein BFP70_05120 [Thioclava sp. SK-1]
MDRIKTISVFGGLSAHLLPLGPGASHSDPAAKRSYALYVWPLSTAHGFMNTQSRWLRNFIKRSLSFLAIFALAHLSTYHFENRFTRWAKRIT